jgi:hypothetical protein
LSLAHAGHHFRAASEAEDLAASKMITVSALYDCACVISLCSSGIKDDAEKKKQYADKAIKILDRAIASGYANMENLKSDDDLIAIRDREDFKSMLSSLEKKSLQNKSVSPIPKPKK